MYYPDAGQTEYKKNRKNSKKKFKVLECIGFIKFVEKSFKEQYWSLGECYGRAKSEKIFKNTVCTKTLYKYVELGILNIKNTDLTRRLKRVIKIDSKSSKPVNDVFLDYIMESKTKVAEVFKSITSAMVQNFQG